MKDLHVNNYWSIQNKQYTLWTLIIDALQNLYLEKTTMTSLTLRPISKCISVMRLIQFELLLWNSCTCSTNPTSQLKQSSRYSTLALGLSFPVPSVLHPTHLRLFSPSTLGQTVRHCCSGWKMIQRLTIGCLHSIYCGWSRGQEWGRSANTSRASAQGCQSCFAMWCSQRSTNPLTVCRSVRHCDRVSLPASCLCNKGGIHSSFVQAVCSRQTWGYNSALWIGRKGRGSTNSNFIPRWVSNLLWPPDFKGIQIHDAETGWFL